MRIRVCLPHLIMILMCVPPLTETPMENKQLVYLLIVLGILVAGMTYYHKTTPSPYDAKAFFGE